MPWFDRYVSAWVLHPVAGSPGGKAELKALLDCYSPDVRYEDVPTAEVFDGHDGIKRMCDSAHILSSDLKFAVLTRQTNGRMFAVETEFWGNQHRRYGSPFGDRAKIHAAGGLGRHH